MAEYKIRVGFSETSKAVKASVSVENTSETAELEETLNKAKEIWRRAKAYAETQTIKHK